MMNVTSKIGVELTLDNGKNVTLFEGDIVKNLEYQKTSTSTEMITGSVRVINATTKINSTSASVCPPEPYMHKNVIINSLIIDNSSEFDAGLVTVDVQDIIDIGEVVENGGTITVGPGSEYNDLADIISVAPVNSNIMLKSGTYESALNITKNITITGNGYDTVLSGAITVGSEVSEMSSDGSNDPVSIILKNVRLTGDALISVNGNVDSFIMDGCTFGGHNMTSKTMPIAIKSTVTEPMLLKIENCIFEDQNEHSYNLIDVYAPLKNGSSISNNHFSENCCTHNQISLYGIADDATINVNDNYVVKSANMIRLGFKDEPKGTVNMNDNTYATTDSSADWAGLAIVQPYGSETVSFAGVTININNTNNMTENEQLIYFYAGGNDTKFTEENKPTVIVDGTDVTAEIPVR